MWDIILCTTTTIPHVLAIGAIHADSSLFFPQESRWDRRGGATIFLLLFLPIATFLLSTCARIIPHIQQALERKDQEIISPSNVSEKVTETDWIQIAFLALVRTTSRPTLAGILIGSMFADVMSSIESHLSRFSAIALENSIPTTLMDR